MSEIKTTLAGKYPSGYPSESNRADVFDPALRQFQFAFVKGEPPQITDGQRHALKWIRKEAIDAGLEAIAESTCADRLVVRGGVTLVEWFPGRARAPKDLDLVVRPESLAAEAADELLQALIRDLEKSLTRHQFRLGEPAIDAIWTYERAEGRRITIPWQSGAMKSELQVDLVFREPMIEAPVPTEVMLAGKPRSILFATRAESLAWKLMWLETDNYPQGKDLFDAILLAQATPISVELLRAVFAAKGVAWEEIYESPELVRRWMIDLAPFRAAYPEHDADIPAIEQETLYRTLQFVP
jgi:hypothetical protein